jgi:cellulose synthase/poly-beta-1,6-N-acetylglucosamine synthase-like glycosyltransferase/peptidoglycan/xylan/chitin deacetylase (PgdA/CDA1 family)
VPPPAPVDARERRLRRYLRRPPGHWLLLALAMTALAAALLLQGFVSEQLGSSSSRPRGGPVAGLAGVGPILDLSGPAVRSVTPAPGEIALTFDDGPDPTWTPKVLAVLRRHHVPATFFMVGARIEAHAGLVSAVLRDGNDIGAHTFTHADLGDVSGVRANLELSLTQTALAGAAGVNTSLLRLPYSSTASDFSPSAFRAARAAGRVGYLVVAATEDGEDWKRPGVDRIVADATPPAGQGGVVLLHDGGGNRAQTVAALDRLIPALQAQGYRFETVSDIAGLDRSSTNARVATLPHLQGMTLARLVQLSALVTGLITSLFVPIGLLSILRGIVVLALAHRHARLVVAPGDVAFLPPVSVVVPAFNEEVGIAAAVRSLAASDYPELEIVVVDDGSTDRTAEIVAGLALPRVGLISQANAGKPAALNAGVAAARHDVLVMVDGDTVFEPDTVRGLVQPLADPRVGAVSGNTKVGNRRGILGRWQHVEYVIGFNLDRRMYDTLRCMPTVPGAIGAFRRQALLAVGGVSGDTLAEDTDLTMAVNRAGWRVVYEERARAWTEAPASLGALWRQRYRWCYGTMQAMWKHRGAVREGGPLGRYGLPYLLLFQVLLPLLAPAVDLFAVYGLLFLDPGPVIAYWAGFNLLQLAMGLYAFRLDRERLGPLWVVPLQQFVYRQLMYLVLIQSVFSAAVGTRLHWHDLRRTGLDRGVGTQAITSS